MASFDGSAGNQFTGLKPLSTIKERERKKFKALLGVCRIKVLKLGEGFKTVGSGCIIEGLLKQALLKNRCCLVTSDKVLPAENLDDIDEFYMEFRKLKPKKIKTVKLGSIADRKASIVRPSSGMVAIILKEHNILSDGQSWRSVVTYRPFSTELNGDESSAFICQVVDDTSETFFDVKSFELKRIDQEFILCDGHMKYRHFAEFVGTSNRKPYGAVILTRGENPKAVGILNFSDDENKEILPILLPDSQIRYLGVTKTV
ncbi:hypothetical protein AWC38_SpisGene16015 [Stylophora pistillata]|uniref:Uncharacterized protein n=1 Tax=Stylophora pistillata TaxID=50429 RepID=A0A2B4RTJ8_STYPI|nr:hypothetical protein AWC38_SpisGene16015 [Stylophora pistillata]